MARRLRALLVALATASLLVGTAAPAAADVATTGSKEHVTRLPPAVDAVVLRPFGMAATVFGTGVFLASSPFFLITRPHEIDEPFKALVAGPAVWTWGRPLGGR